jgi:DNA-directed RNA polymerase subunit RPC12/RpoP
MLPCKLCGYRVVDDQGQPLRGLKRVGKTRYNGSHFERRYRCQDCGAILRMPGEVQPTRDQWDRPDSVH